MRVLCEKTRTKRATRLAVLICAVLAIGGFLTYRHTSSSGHQRINSVSNLRQIGLAFRLGRNDFKGQFVLTGNVVVPKIQPDE